MMLRLALRPVVFLCYVLATVALTVLLGVGWALTKLYNLGGWPDGQERGNCWSFAVPKFLRSPRIAGLLVSLSVHTAVPHVRYVRDVQQFEFEEFVPVQPLKGWRAIRDSFWFRGISRKRGGPRA
jgi:hypothetical protein